jgi:hypothetical protein
MLKPTTSIPALLKKLRREVTPTMLKLLGFILAPPVGNAAERGAFWYASDSGK